MVYESLPLLEGEERIRGELDYGGVWGLRMLTFTTLFHVLHVTTAYIREQLCLLVLPIIGEVIKDNAIDKQSGHHLSSVKLLD